MQQQHVVVIAEAGVNHNGSLAAALELVDAAADSGADYVKFQTFRADRLVTVSAATAAYQRAQTSVTSQRELLTALELSPEAHRAIAGRCRDREIGFLSSAFDPQSLAFLAEFDMDYTKVPSGELTNRFLLEAAGAASRPVLLSTGMATLGEIEAALGVLDDHGLSREEVCVLQCYTDYPAAPRQTNLAVLDTYRRAFGTRVGYSDHTVGIAVPLAAVALGATVIEKHFTLDKSAAGPDHAASLDVGELTELVRGIRAVEAALGNSVKRPDGPELATRELVRKGLYYAADLPAGRALERGDLAAMRPVSGVSPMDYPSLLGRTLVRDVTRHEPLSQADLR